MSNVTTIAAQEFSKLYQNQNNSLTIIDLRTSEEVAESGLANTIKLPVQELTQESFIAALSNAETVNGEVYLLCKSGKRAHTAVGILSDYDERNLVIIEGGLMGMTKA